MSPGTWRFAALLLGATTLALLAFNVWFFFIHRDLGLRDYWERLVVGRQERVTEEPHYRFLLGEFAHLNARRGGEPVHVLAGDSILARFRADERLGRDDVVNRGIYSDTTAGLEARWPESIGTLVVRDLVLLIGINDHEFRTIDEAAQNTRGIVERAQAERIFLLSLLPVYGRGAEANAKIRRHNERLARICDEAPCTFVDVHRDFVGDDGALRRELSNDGIHPNARGYDLLEARLAAILREPLAEEDAQGPEISR